MGAVSYLHSQQILILTVHARVPMCLSPNMPLICTEHASHCAYKGICVLSPCMPLICTEYASSESCYHCAGDSLQEKLGFNEDARDLGSKVGKPSKHLTPLLR